MKEEFRKSISPSFSYIIEQQSCFLTLTERQFSKKNAYSFLEDLAGEFHSQYGQKINTATRPYSFIEFDTYIQVGELLVVKAGLT